MQIMGILRKNIGTIVAAFGFVLLSIITFGDLGDLMTDAYWENVKNNLTSISFMSISLTLIQVAIKQGVSEQALQRGLNTEKTAQTYIRHRDLIKSCTSRLVYLPYFLQIYNDRHTKLKRREFLVENSFSTEQQLMLSKDRRKIRKYKKIRVSLTASRIKWATTEIVYNKHGQIQTLTEHRRSRAVRGIVTSLVFMIGVTFLTRGLFFSGSGEPLWQKFVKLGSYVVVITMTSILSIIREYEKGAFSVPNELEEINEIWIEFQNWEIPQWVITEVNDLNNKKEVDNGRKESETTTNIGTVVSEQQKKSENISNVSTPGVLVNDGSNDSILLFDGKK